MSVVVENNPQLSDELSELQSHGKLSITTKSIEHQLSGGVRMWTVFKVIVHRGRWYLVEKYEERGTA